MIHRMRVVIGLAGSVILAVALCLVLLGTASSGSVVPTNTWIDLYSPNTTYLGQAVPVGAYVAVFDPQGVQCGEFTVTVAGAYGILPCYGDDAATPGVDEGAEPGDVLRFTINGAAAQAEVVSIDGTPLPSTTLVTWAGTKNLWQVNLHARLDVSQHMLHSSTNPATLGESITFTTSVIGVAPGGLSPTGSVQFRADGAALGAPVGLVAGSAAVSTALLAAGTHTITAEYSGDALFTPGTTSLVQVVLPYEKRCGLVEMSYDFSASGHVRVEIIELGALGCLQVQPMLGSHPYASGGIATGQYWLITGTTGLGGPAGGFSVTLTLPALFTPDGNDKLCRYVGPGQVWDCAASSFDALNLTISRAGVGAFSTWAVGNDVGPNAVAMTHFGAHAAGQVTLWLALLGIAAAGALLAWVRAKGLGFSRQGPRKDML